MLWFEKFSLFMNGLTSGMLLSLFVQWLAYRRLKKKTTPPATPHPMQQLVDRLKNSGIAVEVLESVGGPNCPCPNCVANRKIKTRGENDALH